MKIAMIGHGNVGGTLAKRWSKTGNEIIIGARDLEDPPVAKLTSAHEHIQATTIQSAVDQAEVVLVAIPAPAVGILA